MTREDSSISATQRAINESAARNKIDWTAVRTSTCSWTFEELSRYSHCRVSPYVFAVARALCSQFSISASARKELTDLKQLLDTSGDDSSHHVLHLLTASDEGLTVLGVCGILNDYFHSAALAEFFETLAKMSGMPETLRPARGRWMELARICGKIQPPDSFHSLAQDCSRLGLVEEAGNSDLEEGVGPIGVVSCIQGMSEISSGEDDGRIIMLCGRSAGWHAAIAEWMFGLRIKLTIRDGMSFEGKTVLSNCQDDQVQLTLAFNNAGVPTDGSLVDDPPMPIKYQKEN
ncbi:hypothetical protein H2200_001766 [Cladophialophora chaetospira]|uniref:Uncharacterized protein n=1 Tax=Cladophialophora chaetospira TaxID=386627 RepID=A0AA38XLT7_9EURO|nr:hypothetical protein H2200_001766 [Cladophialophora chaetospira]